MVVSLLINSRVDSTTTLRETQLSATPEESLSNATDGGEKRYPENGVTIYHSM
jgi:hypothetical protein